MFHACVLIYIIMLQNYKKYRRFIHKRGYIFLKSVSELHACCIDGKTYCVVLTPKLLNF